MKEPSPLDSHRLRVFGQRKPAGEALAELDSSLDRSHFILNPFAGNPECDEAQNQAEDAAHGEH